MERTAFMRRFVFINNYERLANLPVQESIRLELHLTDNTTLSIPRFDRVSYIRVYIKQETCLSNIQRPVVLTRKL